MTYHLYRCTTNDGQKTYAVGAGTPDAAITRLTANNRYYQIQPHTYLGAHSDFDSNQIDGFIAGNERG